VPKPSALKKAAGNPGRRQLNENEPVPPTGDAAAPFWVTGRALEIWNQLAPIARTMRTLTTADALTFGRYCVVFARWIELQEFVWRSGPAGTTWTKRARGSKRKGDGDAKPPVDHVFELPQAAELRKLLEQLVRLEDRFGLSAAARSRIAIHLAAPTPPSAAAASPELDDKQRLLRLVFTGGGPAAPRPARGAG